MKEGGSENLSFCYNVSPKIFDRENCFGITLVNSVIFQRSKYYFME